MAAADARGDVSQVRRLLDVTGVSFRRRRSCRAPCAPPTAGSSGCWRSPAPSPSRAFSAEDLRVTEVLADLAAFALERAQLLDDEEALGRAGRALGATLDPGYVIAATVTQ